jgi:2-keto-4-pentenoate hydratase/2-oxohepta-3-ene-1,7-dioic acid hydratase in catechol pathway
MRLARFLDSATPHWGFVEDDRIHPVAPGSPSLVDALAGGAVGELRAAAGAPRPLDQVRLLAPIERPGKIVCVGLNYRAHAEESGLALPAEPLLFMKYPNAVTGPRDEIVLPPESDQVDWEVELALVIGARVERVDRTRALAAVAGFAVANDISARDLQASDGQWIRAKSFRTFCPLGPWITTADEVGDGSGLDISLSVNGVVKQHSNTSDLIADVAAIVRHASNVGALEPGDIVLTGTPAGTGVGQRPPEFLAAGDVVTARVEGLGELVNRVVAHSGAGGPG